MARLPRLTVPGYPHHLIQRGNNRQAIFATDGDYDTLLSMGSPARVCWRCAVVFVVLSLLFVLVCVVL